MIQRILWLSIALFVTFGCQNNNKNNGSGEHVAADSSAAPLASKKNDLERLPTTEEEIRTAYAAILSKMESGKLDSSSFDYDCSGERSGRVTYYTDDKQLVLIQHHYGEFSHHEFDQNYFISHGKLFFAYQKAVSWSFDSVAGQEATKDDVTEDRSYFADGRPIRCLQKKYVIRSTAKDNPTPADVANADRDCEGADAILDTYKLLAARQQKPTNDCIE